MSTIFVINKIKEICNKLDLSLSSKDKLRLSSFNKIKIFKDIVRTFAINNTLLWKIKKRTILRDTIISDAKRLMEIHPEYRYGQSVFNIVDQCIGLARTVQFCDGIDCFYDDEKVDAFIEKVIDRMEKYEDNEENEKKD